MRESRFVAEKHVKQNAREKEKSEQLQLSDESEFFGLDVVDDSDEGILGFSTSGDIEKEPLTRAAQKGKEDGLGRKSSQTNTRILGLLGLFFMAGFGVIVLTTFAHRPKHPPPPPHAPESLSQSSVGRLSPLNGLPDASRSFTLSVKSAEGITSCGGFAQARLDSSSNPSSPSFWVDLVFGSNSANGAGRVIDPGTETQFSQTRLPEERIEEIVVAVGGGTNTSVVEALEISTERDADRSDRATLIRIGPETVQECAKNMLREPAQVGETIIKSCISGKDGLRFGGSKCPDTVTINSVPTPGSGKANTAPDCSSITFGYVISEDTECAFNQYRATDMKRPDDPASCQEGCSLALDGRLLIDCYHIGTPRFKTCSEMKRQLIL